jgi:hypothetical protein
MPVINFKGGDQQTDGAKLTVTEEVDQEYMFEPATLDATAEAVPEPVTFMHYSRSFKKIIMGTQ